MSPRPHRTKPHRTSTEQGRDEPAESATSQLSRARRASAALFLAGFGTFSLIYCTQPLLPEFSREFGVGPAESALAVSLTTACLAFAILGASLLSEGISRRRLMFASLALAAVCNLLAALAPSWEWLLVARALQGIALGGMPAVAMAYLAEEMPPERLTLTVGFYVGGTAFGGMAGRVATGALSEVLSWRAALASAGLISLITALLFLLLLPRSRHFIARKGITARAHLAIWRDHLQTPGLLALFLVGFLTLGGFMAVYNYVGFRLSAPPYALNQAQIGLIFFAYLGGVAASPLAGAWAIRMGHGSVMLAGACLFIGGLTLTLLQPLYAIVTGITVLTIGFFMVHSIASSWVGRLAALNRSHAASLYLLAYYAGASLLGMAGGWIWKAGGWSGVTAYCAALMLVVSAIAVGLQRSVEDPKRSTEGRKRRAEGQKKSSEGQ